MSGMSGWKEKLKQFEVSRYCSDDLPDTQTVFAKMKDFEPSSAAGYALTITLAQGGEDGSGHDQTVHSDFVQAAKQVGLYTPFLLSPHSVITIQTGTLVARVARDPYSQNLITQWRDERYSNAVMATTKYANDGRQIVEWAMMVGMAFLRSMVVEQKVAELARIAMERAAGRSGVVMTQAALAASGLGSATPLPLAPLPHTSSVVETTPLTAPVLATGYA